jgi:chemotaxis protein methyltransferase CheR
MTAESPRMTLEEHRLLNELISDLSGVHFPVEKREVLEARLRPRLAALRLSRFMDYYLTLQYDGEEEIDHLTHEITNNETYFFRETRQFDGLFQEAVGDLKRSPAVDGELRVLCAGCSSGEEPYTVSIYAGIHPFQLAGLTARVDGFDIDRKRVEIARRAEYRPRSLRTASEEQIRAYFVRGGTDQYALRDRYRAGVRIEHGNILDRDTYPSAVPYDAIFCRNVLIYFSEPAIHRAIECFAATLRPGGILFLGHSESIIGLSPAFETVRLERCIAYRRT